VKTQAELLAALQAIAEVRPASIVVAVRMKRIAVAALDGWRKVVFAAECDPDTGGCPACGEDFGECPCFGPTQDGIEYCEIDGVLYGRAESQ
jgi:hypothetical protein